MLQLDDEPFIHNFNSTGPFEGVPDDVDIEDIPANPEAYSLHLNAEVSEEHRNATPHARGASQSNTALYSPASIHETSRERHFFHRQSQGGKSSDTDSVCLPFPVF